MIVFAAIMPHPLESVLGISKPENIKAIKKTLESFEKLREDLEKADPETIVIISPHAHLEPYSFAINSASELVGSFSEFGLDKEDKFLNDINIIDKLESLCLQKEMPVKLYSGKLDYGAFIPLYHLTKNIKPKIVHLSFSMMSYEFHYRYGETLQKVIDGLGKRVAIVASGNLSHRLTPNAPAGFYPEAKKFDAKVLHYLGSNNLAGIMSFDKKNTKAAECGLRSIIILLGALHGKDYKFELLSYEYPIGIGYLTARLV